MKMTDEERVRLEIRLLWSRINYRDYTAGVFGDDIIFPIIAKMSNKRVLDELKMSCVPKCSDVYP